MPVYNPNVTEINAVRQEIINPDLAGAEIQFVRASGGDAEMIVSHNGKQQGSYLIGRDELLRLSWWIRDEET